MRCAAISPLYGNGFMLLPSYTGRRQVVIRIGEVLPEIEESRISDGMTAKKIKRKITVVDVYYTEDRKFARENNAILRE